MKNEANVKQMLCPEEEEDRKENKAYESSVVWLLQLESVIA